MEIKGFNIIEDLIGKLTYRATNAEPAWRDIGLQLTKRLRRNVVYYKGKESYAPPGVKGKTLSRTGNLANSFYAIPSPYGVTIASRAKYAAIQNFGGVIVPKRKQALTIPLHKKSYGRWVESLKNEGYSIFKVITKKLNTILFAKKEKETFPAYLLRKRVEIPARRFDEIKDEDFRFIRRRMIDWMLRGM